MRRAISSFKAGAALLGCAVALCAIAPTALAQEVTVPPGSSEADQYSEVVPTGDGNSSINRGGGGAVAADQALRALGPEGQAAADLANATLPQAVEASDAPSAADKPSSEGMGILLPITLGITLLAAVAYAGRRRLNPA
jgi:hypothetical protein